jgi:hypothetical protein
MAAMSLLKKQSRCAVFVFLSASLLAILSNAGSATTIKVSPTSINFTATLGNSAGLYQYVDITDITGATIGWSAGTNATWLAALGTGSSTMTIVEVVNGRLQTPGVYHASAIINSAGATNSPLAIPVTFNLNAAGTNPPPNITPALSIQVYPNPWRQDKHAAQPITFAGLTSGDSVKIFTLAGHQVKSVQSGGSTWTWDRKNDSGDSVASGIYLYFVSDRQGNTARGTIAIIR